MSITGEPDGQPMSVGVPIVDITAAYNAVISVLAALRVREQTGRGQLLRDLAAGHPGGVADQPGQATT